MVEHRQVRSNVQRETVEGASPHDPHPDRRDLPGCVTVRFDPDARVAIQSSCSGDPDVGERIDHELFDRAHVRDGVGAGASTFAGQGEDRIADELTRTVIRDVAATVGLHDRGAAGRGGGSQVRRIGPHAEGVGVRVFEEEQMVVGPGASQPVHQRVGVTVGDPAQPAQTQGHASSTAQSLVSRFALICARNAAA